MSIFYPDILVNGIEEVTNQILKQLDVNSILLDVDDTVSPVGETMISNKVKKWVSNVKKNSIKIIIISNNSKDRVEYFARELDLPYIYKAKKPLPFGIKRAMRIISAESLHTAIVGDQIFTDVLGAKVCGIKSILVEPLSEEGNMGIKVKRYMELYIKKQIRANTFILKKHK